MTSVPGRESARVAGDLQNVSGSGQSLGLPGPNCLILIGLTGDQSGIVVVLVVTVEVYTLQVVGWAPHQQSPKY